MENNQVKLSIFGITDTGMLRPYNQDSYLIAELTFKNPMADYSTSHFIADTRVVIEQTLTPAGCLLAVADGMGGAAAGDIASQLGIDTLLAELSDELAQNNPAMTVQDRLKKSVENANLRLWQESQINIEYRGMGTTLTAAYIQGATAHIAQVGDSRAYLVRDGHIGQLTRDQSAVQMLLDLGRITPEQALHFPNRNIILQALGVEPIIQVAMTRVRLCRGDYLILCSDGLTNKLDDEELLDYLREEKQLDLACQRMVDEANRRGGEDNITLVVARLEGAGLPEPDPCVTMWSSVEVLSSYQPQEHRRGVHTSRMVRVDVTEYRKRSE